MRRNLPKVTAPLSGWSGLLPRCLDLWACALFPVSPVHQTPVDLNVNADSVSESPVGPEVVHL